MQSRESFQTAKILVDFIRDFTSLTEAQLKVIRQIMEGTVQEIMESVGDLSATTTQAAARQNQSSTHNAMDGLEAGDSASLEDQLLTAGGDLSKRIEAVSTLDTEVQKILARVVGSVSMDDVLGQRLNHVIQSITSLSLIHI